MVENMIKLIPPRVNIGVRDVRLGDDKFSYDFLISGTAIIDKGEFAQINKQRPFVLSLRFYKVWTSRKGIKEEYIGYLLLWYEKDQIHYTVHMEEVNNKRPEFYKRLLNNNIVELVEAIYIQLCNIEFEKYNKDNVLGRILEYLETRDGLCTT